MICKMTDFQIKLAAVEQCRKTAAPLPAGIAPQVSSDLYRLQLDSKKPSAEPWDHRLSEESRARRAATLKASASAKSTIEAINLGTARPASKYQPWQGVSITGFQASKTADLNDSTSSSFVANCTKDEPEWDFGTAMNYGWATGSPQLLRFVTEHVELIHDPPYQDWECCLTSGTTSALEMIFRILCNRGDTILTEAYSYPGTLEAIKPLGINTLGIAMDDGGLRPDDLEDKLSQWDTTQGPKPSVLYMVPCGQNPTGATQPLKRRRDIYTIAQRHDLLIIEDDPYYFLILEAEIRTKSFDYYINSLPTSYLSLDTSGRVLRLDATSKILAPGLRAGWLTCCAQLMSKFLCHTECSTTAPSGPSQIMLYKTLDETWGHEGFIRWLMHLSAEYGRCRDVMVKACEDYLPKCVCSFSTPVVGMFVWIDVDLRRHPSATVENPGGMGKESVDALAIEERIFGDAKARGVQVSRGSWFAVGEEMRLNRLAFRMTFAAAAEEMLEEAVRRFAGALKKEFGLECN